MNDPDITAHTAGVLRVERGRADAEEVAALTVLLLGLRAKEQRRAGERPVPDRRRRPDRQAYRAPNSWQ